MEDIMVLFMILIVTFLGFSMGVLLGWLLHELDVIQ